MGMADGEVEVDGRVIYTATDLKSDYFRIHRFFSEFYNGMGSVIFDLSYSCKVLFSILFKLINCDTPPLKIHLIKNNRLTRFSM